MKIDYVCHACLMIDTGDLKIVTDPWFAGPAYCGQWHVFPKPVNVERLHDADVILISHGHEDHLHEPSLRTLQQKKKIFYPYLFYGGTKKYLESMDFKEVVEAHSNRTYKLNRTTSVTYIINELDSIIVIESNGKTIVNINDALHADSEASINLFVNFIKGKYPNIDVVFCGFGGASYYPNTFHLPGKNDFEIGELREQAFIHNFCKIIYALQPKIAIPFAADFVLLEADQRWINHIRFPRSAIKDYYQTYFHDRTYEPAIFEMYSGDSLQDGRLVTSSPYRNEIERGGLNHLIEVQYPEVMSGLSVDTYLSKEAVDAFEHELASKLNSRSRFYDRATLERVHFCITLLDVRELNHFNIDFDDGRFTVLRADRPDVRSILTLQTTTRILSYALSSDWGGNAISIGYGCKVDIPHRDIIASGLHRVCMNLLTRTPKLAQGIRRDPLRVTRALLSNQGLRLRYKNRFLKKRKPSDLFEGQHWLLQSKVQICQTFHLPVRTGKEGGPE